MIGDIGMGELLIIFLIILILFGADRIPQLARGLGKGIRDFKRIVNNAQDEIQRVVDFEEPPSRPIPPPRLEEKKKPDKNVENDFEEPPPSPRLEEKKKPDTGE